MVNAPLETPYTLSADHYMTMAKNQTGSAQHTTLIMAAGRLIEEGQWRSGRAILSHMNDVVWNWLIKNMCY